MRRTNRVLVFIMALFLITNMLFASNIQPVNNIKPSEIHFIDTGNSDAILIKDNGQTMLIDGADNNDEKTLVEYLKKQDVKKLDYLVLTHPDADHCGGLDNVIKNFEVGTVFIGNGSADTKTYKDFVQAAMDKNLKPSVPLDNEFKLGNGIFKFYNQNSTAKEVNDRSLVMLYKNGEHEFLFTGDAGKEVEKAILEKMVDVDVLKVGHHGSNSSTSQEFLDKVKPEVAVITCGKDNKYGHPHKDVAKRLEKIQTYRTDLNGNIVLTSDGKTLTVTTSKVNGAASTTNTSSEIVKSNTSSNSVVSPTQPVKAVEEKAWVTGSGKKYHIKSCRFVNNTSKEFNISAAKSQGYEPCKVCH